MDKYKEILRYHHAQLSQRQIASVMGVSRNTVAKAINALTAAGISWSEVKPLTEAELLGQLFPKTNESTFQVKPDFGDLATELHKPGVTKKLLWEEYVRNCQLTDKLPLQYAQFCVHFNRYLETNKATAHFEHEPGAKIEVDWTGQTINIINSDTGEITLAYLFVATLPYSQYSYVEVTSDMKQENWINAHVNMFEFFGGTTPLLTCDNLKTGVTKHPRHGAVVLNGQYQELADYYDTVVLPAKVRTPKMKPSVEATVDKVSTNILARLRHEIFHTVYEANLAVQASLKEFNNKAFQKRAGSRTEIFSLEERAHLQPLPINRYEYGTWKIATVQYNYHIAVDKMYYSVPYEYIKHKVNVRITQHLIEVFFQQTRICSHRRLIGQLGQYATNKDHLPTNHLQANEWNAQRFISWAQKIGPDTKTVVERLLESYQVEQQAYNGCSSILKLADQYSQVRLEAACKRALSIIYAPRYRNIKLIIQTNQSKVKSPIKDDQTHAILRGNDYYGKGDQK